uniref:Uncharacterized protein n=1 Tax=Aegilops tauschii subsp. strangulata TaxID=200361 RepID=A0A453MK89_AEGTS
GPSSPERPGSADAPTPRSLLPEHGRKADPVPVLPHTQPHPSPLSGEKMAAVQVASGLSVPLLSALLGGAVALVFLAGYL